MSDPHAVPPPSISRRGLLGGVCAGAALAGPAARALTQVAPRPRDPLLALVERTTYGSSVLVLDQARGLGYEGWLDHQLAHEDIDDSDLEAGLAQLPTLTMTGQELHDTFIASGLGPLQPILELDVATLLRSIFSPRQLRERLVEFWSDHFNVYHYVPGIDVLKTVDDRETVRPHALGRFRDLLGASTRSGAMLIYLDNVSNVVGSPNENYARELLELHTLGVGGGYGERDVREFARCLTGWTMYPAESGEYGRHLFFPPLHDDGPKSLLGLDLPAGGGAQDVELVLDHLAASPATARFVCGKLARYLLVEDPPQAVVDAAVQVWLATDGDLREVVRCLLSRDALLAADPWNNPKFKRPYHQLVSIARATFPVIDDPFGMLDFLGRMGHIPFTWPPPDGFPDTLARWGPAVRPRWELASAWFDGQVQGLEVPDEVLHALAGEAGDPGAAHAINLALTGGRLSPEDEATIQDFLDQQAPVDPFALRRAFALAVASPSFQLF